MYNVHEVLSWQPQTFYICKPCLFFHIYDPLSIPCLEVIFIANSYDLFTTIHKDFTFCSHACSITSMTTYRFLVCQTYFFFFIYVNNFWNCTSMCTYTKDIMLMKSQVDGIKYFTFVGHICSFTTMIPLVFHIWQSYLSCFFMNVYCNDSKLVWIQKPINCIYWSVT